MRPALILILCLSYAGVGIGQTPSPANAAAPAETAVRPDNTPTPNTRRAVEKRIERIRIDDTHARIDELRVGGETQSITVQPKGGMPAYQVQPTSGERSWKILGF